MSAASATRARILQVGTDRYGSEMTLIAQEIKRVRPEVPTIVLTERATPENKIPELCRLADELVPKEQGPEAILMSVRRVLGKQASASITRAK